MNSKYIIPGLVVAIVVLAGFIIWQFSVRNTQPTPTTEIKMVGQVPAEETVPLLNEQTPAKKDIDTITDSIDMLIIDLDEDANFTDFEDLQSY